MMRILSSKKPIIGKQIFILLGIVFSAIIILPQFKSFSGSLENIKNADYKIASLALILTILSYFAAAGTYYFLASKHLKYFQTVIVQFVASFVNRLLPAGIGALGVSYGYLKRRGHGNLQSATIVSMNNLFGLIGNSLIVLIVILIGGIEIPITSNLKVGWVYLTLILIMSAITIYLVSNKKRQSKILKALKDLKKQFRFYRLHPNKLILALISSTTLSLCNFLSLMICVNAVGGSATFAVVVIVYSLGIGVGSSIPTPGGLGGVEAAMVGGFVAFGTPANIALSAVLLYRLISFWLMTLIGALGFVYVQEKKILKFRD